MLNMPRAKNLRLARFLVDGFGNLTKLLNSPSATTLIKQGQGRKAATDADVTRYASELGLAQDWFDRDNDSLLRMSKLDYELVVRVRALSDEHKAALFALIAPTT
jgi:hypothetical protein